MFDDAPVAALDRVLAVAGLFQASVLDAGRVIRAFALALAQAVAAANYIGQPAGTGSAGHCRVEAAVPVDALIALVRDLRQSTQFPDRIIHMTSCAPVCCPWLKSSALWRTGRWRCWPMRGCSRSYRSGRGRGTMPARHWGCPARR
ncbi:MAG: hypothetical protein Q4G22_04890 [Paracoccus sp. (in: a-proteobacteria)]|uniref:hypothetical protein n=1 Tax=Paracoccus sp. TaxID=267 RepID=UPI0026DEA290|nr:hypothetical protein [Paracoccus sp. (in: a-proteobacteria)]MDO5631156.1 hypothetical protein [Paracoccus sp. (in: a-proteobacteria)]